MKVLIASSEVVPFSKTGGLADVTGALPYALKEAEDCDVRVIAPFYKMTKDKNFKMKKCIYCKCAIDDKSVIDFCERCGIKVWGPNMFKAIKQNMEDAQDRGDLFQG